MVIKKIIPTSLKEALSYISSHDVYLCAGGTDLMVQKRNDSLLPPKFDKDVVYLKNLKELNYIYDKQDGLHIGSMTSLFEIESCEQTPKLLKDVISKMASSNIRHMATLSGNIGNASPAGDSLVVLYVLDAKLVLASSNNERIVPISDYIFGVRKTILQKDELIKEIIIPHHQSSFEEFYKVGSRKADSISKISFAGVASVKDGVLLDLRLAFGSVNIKVMRSKEIENKYIGKKVSELSSLIPNIVNDYDSLIAPISDQRSSKEYRKEVANNILKDFLDRLIRKGEC